MTNGNATPYLVDTDIFIDHLRGARRLVAQSDMAYSIITRCELFAGARADEAAVRTLLHGFTEIPLTTEVAEAAGRLRRGGGILIADALIAATALEHGRTLMTRNRRDFERVSGLTLDVPGEHSPP